MFATEGETVSLSIHTDLTTEELIKLAVARGEGILAANNALAVYTGKYTGRSPQDRFIVDDAQTHDTVAWGMINQPFSPEKFDLLWRKANDYINEREHFITHLRVGADVHHYLPVKVVTEHAWQSLFAQQLFIRESIEEDTRHQPWTLLSVPGCQANPKVDGTKSETAIILNFSKRAILICGTHYAGELKKSMFSALNFLMPAVDVLPMHCAANAQMNGQDTVLFFGLSGTGKTTLSADPERFLIGDDEHGWSDAGVFNFEGGCYAKCIDLSQKNEPIIWDAIRFGTIMENVVLDENTLQPIYSDTRYTQNTRAAYPREFIEKRVPKNLGAPPVAVVFLTCDLYGVLPPVSRLTQLQAAYYFLSGYTALVGSTERGAGQGINPTFSTCFGAPFFSRPAQVYANLLLKRLQQTNSPVYLVNTGWSGGSLTTGGKRFDIPTTRRVVSAITKGELRNANFVNYPHFNIEIPTQIAGIEDKLLNPALCWSDHAGFEQSRKELIQKFRENFKKFAGVDAMIIAAGPQD